MTHSNDRIGFHLTADGGADGFSQVILAPHPRRMHLYQRVVQGLALSSTDRLLVFTTITSLVPGNLLDLYIPISGHAFYSRELHLTVDLVNGHVHHCMVTVGGSTAHELQAVVQDIAALGFPCGRPWKYKACDDEDCQGSGKEYPSVCPGS